MKGLTAIAAATALAALVPAAAQAQPWQSIHSRQTRLYQRIEMGIRDGSLTRAEASHLRTRYANLSRLEWRYQRNGLSAWERRDLDRRFDSLSRDIRYQRHDWQTRQRRRWR